VGAKARDDILCSAADLIHVNRVAGTSIDDVLKATGTGKSQFYYYFDSKNDLAGGPSLPPRPLRCGAAAIHRETWYLEGDKAVA
jgi:Bacterial regulatory proteins, tetR family